MLASSLSSSGKQQSGFTLIEVIVGIVVLAIALVVITGALGPLYKRSADPWHQVRAAELGHSLLNEIMARSFDENSDRSGGEFRCGEAGYQACSDFCNNPVAVNLAENETRAGFDDVDDFNGLQLNGSDIVGSAGSLALSSLYVGYQANVAVSCVGTDGQVNNEVKEVIVTITTPSGETLAFSAYRSNW
ncbi:prepilin-type N-terminal cleavage/methylation domain-containing protein [Rheinheimera sp. 1928-s]|uniref:type IV pilus modification PilV family protein n=1 Tax=Rheinheimera sp. 1928-s TaxID=3033803 RepID=UPI00263855B2|nr:prepilin-type N-terminal cleavage/methylation domain-containing protein [Rheinheimera sp. 1928-s]MDF3124919.1 prepilin-type N-terminal cleavage/methylation domain-containing protein [Rheinheimera sp. 1928-s]